MNAFHRITSRGLPPLFFVGVVVAGACGSPGSGEVARLEVLEPAAIGTTPESADPSLAVDPETGELLLAWAGGEEGEWNLYFARSGDGGATFTSPAQVNDIPGDLHPHAEGAPRLVAAPGVAALFWNNSRAAEGRRFAASDLRFARSLDGGANWTPAISLQDPVEPVTLPPRANTFHGAAWAGGGTLVVAWLDGRERDRRRIRRGVDVGLSPEEAARTPEAFVDEEDPHDGDAAVYAAVSHDLGANWEAANRRIQGNICPCCRVTLARTPGGDLLGSWRQHFDGSIRDPALQTVYSHGDQAEDSNGFSGVAVRIHEDRWVYPGCPHSGPGLDVDPDGVVHAAWYTGAEGRTGVHYARSADPFGEGFSAPVPVAAGESVGVAHPALVALPGGGAVVAHNVDAEGRRVVVLTGISPSGDVAFRREVPDSEGGTHPQVVRLPGGDVVAAWTESRGGAQRVRMARLGLEGTIVAGLPGGGGS